MQGGTVLGRIDRLPGEERVDPAAQAARIRKRGQRVERGRVEALPAEIEQQAAGFAREMAEAAGVLGEESGDRQAGEAPRVACEGISQDS